MLNEIVEYKPKSLEELQQQYPEAIKDLMEDAFDGSIFRPQHFFDTEEGFRLIVTRNQMLGIDVVSVTGCIIYGPNVSATKAVERITVLMQQISGYRLTTPSDYMISKDVKVDMYFFLSSQN